jgi:hypothetical protein
MKFNTVLLFSGMFFVARLAAQDIPVISAGVPEVRYCSDGEIRSVRVSVPLSASNPGRAAAVVPRLVSVTGHWIRDLTLGNGQEAQLNSGSRPQPSEHSLRTLEPEGSVAIVRNESQQNIVGLYFIFVTNREDAHKMGATSSFLLRLGNSYEIRTTLRLWNDELLAWWRRLGYRSRLEASVSARFDVSAIPKWVDCPQDPSFVLAHDRK